MYSIFYYNHLFPKIMIDILFFFQLEAFIKFKILKNKVSYVSELLHTPEGFECIEEVIPKKWTYKKWDLKNCNSKLIIQEMPLINPDYDCFVVNSFYK